jgi:hypothetical protein
VSSYELTLVEYLSNIEHRCDIYHKQGQYSLLSALRINFPVTRVEMGSEIFDALAIVYARHYPSRYWDINDYGAGFDVFIGAQNQQVASGQNWLDLARLAKLERAICSAYYSDESEIFFLDADVNSNSQIHHALICSCHPYVSLGNTVNLKEYLMVYSRDGKVHICSGIRCIEGVNGD